MTEFDFPTSSTGGTPVQSFGPEFGGRSDWSHRDWTLTAGYLDAPDLIPAGCHGNNNFDEVPVSRYVPR